MSSFFKIAPLVAAFGLITFAAFAEEGPAQCTLDKKLRGDVAREIKAFMHAHSASVSDASFTLLVKSKGGQTERELARLIEREQACCSHLSFAVKPSGRDIAVTVTGPYDEVTAAANMLR